MKKNKFAVIALVFIIIFLIQPQNREQLTTFFTQHDVKEDKHQKQNAALKKKVFDKQQVISVNEKAQFTSQELSLKKGSWERYSDLDFLGRVGEANAMLGKELMPQEKREDISSVYPSGWKNKKIIFNGKKDYLYNRSHLIAYELSGENANVKNLFTGTRALNANFLAEKNSMVYYENLIAQYIKTTGHHVRYRVTPLFKNVELVCRGIRMEAQSIEDHTISFDIYIFNIQPNYEINYLTGTSQIK